MSGKQRGSRGKTIGLVVGVLVLTAAVLGGCLLIKQGKIVMPTGKSTDNHPSSVSETDNSEPENITKVAEATVSVTGDLIGHDAILKSAKGSKSTYNFDSIFTYIKDYADQSDYAIANLETTLAGDKKKYTGYPTFNTPDAIVDAVINANFDMLLTANNHSYDTGLSGMKRTVQVLDKKGIDHTGTYLNAEDKRYLVKEINGIKIGMLCYTYETNGTMAGRKYLNGGLMDKIGATLINSFSYKRLDDFYAELDSQIDAMKAEGAEAVVMFIHWGTEYKIAHNNTQKKIAQGLCNHGVDVIVGGHPHVVQPIELLTDQNDPSHRTVCLYSMGNAVSNQRASFFNKLKTGHTEDGVLFSVTFAKYSDGAVQVADVNLLPTWVNLCKDSATKKNVFRIVPLDKSVENWQSAFALDDEAMTNANKSYKRTMELVQEGLETSQTFYRDRDAQKLNSYQ